MVVIRPEKPQDYAGIHEVNRLAFRRESEARLVENLRVSPGFIPELALVAVGGKNVVGYVLLSPVNLETPDGSIPTLALMPMAVRPEFLKEDVGLKLLRHAFKECQRQGYKCVVAVGPPERFAPYGFIPAQRKDLRSLPRIPGGELMVLELETGTLDDTRGTIKFPPLFSELWETVAL